MSGAAWDDEELAARRIAAYHRLAKLTDAEYTRVRKAEALSLGMPVAELDAAVKKARRAKHPTGAWQNDLVVTVSGSPKACSANAIVAMQRDPAWAGVLRFNEFTQRVEISAPPWATADAARDVTDEDHTLAAAWLQNAGIAVEAKLTRGAMRVVAKQHTYHPIRDYLTGLFWDGVERIDTWLSDFLGAEDTPLNRAFGARFLIGAVARVMRPGCKLDTVLVLEGGQGIGKSNALATLAGAGWFSDQSADWATKDAKQENAGTWIREIAEFGAIKRADVENIKAFITARVDRFRPAYGAEIVEIPRQCVFAATINRGGSGYLKDETGARRFWCVECGEGKIGIPALAAARDQLWAEARARYAFGDAWWLDTAALEALQAEAADERLDTDPWTDIVVRFLETPGCVVDATGTPVEVAPPNTVRTADLLAAIGIPRERWSRADQIRVGAIIHLQKNWIKRRDRGGARGYRYDRAGWKGH